MRFSLFQSFSAIHLAQSENNYSSFIMWSHNICTQEVGTILTTLDVCKGLEEGKILHMYRLSFWIAIYILHTAALLPTRTTLENQRCQGSYWPKARAAATTAGFEPTREFPSGFLVHHLNHSVKWPQRRMLLAGDFLEICFDRYASYLHISSPTSEVALNGSQADSKVKNGSPKTKNDRINWKPWKYSIVKYSLVPVNCGLSNFLNSHRSCQWFTE